MLGGVPGKITAFCAAVALCAGPSFASASTVSAGQQQISPMVALSIFGSQASASALCGAAVTSSASAAATAQAPVGGCVLPVVDAPPPLPVAEAAPIAPLPAAGVGITPILLGLAGIAILAALIASQGSGNDNNPPVSVN
ncbi:hypothetical protein [Sphingomonas sp.]|uniref:hypothetical protein n=1 Tax=Sphingomonas sp. TaxID=28214 RepID=UPI00286A2A75|nr:hypothetical protein [Sphingomonas sp.]